jgi:hypothetical protein
MLRLIEKITMTFWKRLEVWSAGASGALLLGFGFDSCDARAHNGWPGALVVLGVFLLGWSLISAIEGYTPDVGN